MNLSWYLRRAARMNARELARRARDEVVKRALMGAERRLSTMGSSRARGRFVGSIDPVLGNLPEEVHMDLIQTAERVLDGRIRVFGTWRSDMDSEPDWFFDPRSGLRAPDSERFGRINHRQWPGSIKHVWEPSRLQHLTVLAAASALSWDDRYVDALEAQLKSWWRANPPFRGVNWVSGIELGIRLISWVWIRRLIHDETRARALFEENDDFLNQLYAHQIWLEKLPSHGSSANNHLVAEAAGQFSAAAAFPLFSESDRWRAKAGRILENEIHIQVDDQGLHRELATDYHGFVCELFLSAALEGEQSGDRFSDDFWIRIRSMIDAIASFLDAQGRPPRQGDSDDGIGLLVDGEGYDRWASLLRTGERLFGPADWWPRVDGSDVRTELLTGMGAAPNSLGPRPARMQSHFREAGLVLLRRETGTTEEIWCRCDSGPLGFLATAAHGHADALSVEVRYGGTDILADPGTFCYQYQPEWREFFRSIAAHNTLEIQGVEQAKPLGTFIWSSSIDAQTAEVRDEPGRDRSLWTASYSVRDPGRDTITHARSVEISPLSVTVWDTVSQSVQVSLRYHLGPEVHCEIVGSRAELSWHSRRAVLELPERLEWSVIRGQEEPPMGWYSPRFDVRVPAFTMEGVGNIRPGEPLVTHLAFDQKRQ